MSLSPPTGKLIALPKFLSWFWGATLRRRKKGERERREQKTGKEWKGQTGWKKPPTKINFCMVTPVLSSTVCEGVYDIHVCCCCRAERPSRHGAGWALSGPSSDDAARARPDGRRGGQTAVSTDRRSAHTVRRPAQQVRSAAARSAASQDRQSARRRAGVLPRRCFAARRHRHTAAARWKTALWNVQELVAR